MASIVLRDVEKYFGDNYIVRKLNLEIRHREFLVLLGPSGCGKTTTLRAIAGLEEIDSGEILIDGQPVQSRQAADRDIAFVFQLFALYPHLTAYGNIAFPLRATNEKRNVVDRRVREVAKALRIDGLLDKRPSALSGGDMQRVAIGRALVRRPKALLMDEPMGALDAKLREEMRAELKHIHIENEATTVYVTHDQVEAMAMADRIAIMNDGVLQQVGLPADVYQYPVNLFVAQFVGSPIMNVVDCQCQAGPMGTEVRLAGMVDPFVLPASAAAPLAGHNDERLALGIRPEAIGVALSAEAGHVQAKVHLIEPLGAYDIVDIAVGDARLRARTPSQFVRAQGDAVWIRLDHARTHFFDKTSGRRLQAGS